jgi:hypothetical protein
LFARGALVSRQTRICHTLHDKSNEGVAMRVNARFEGVAEQQVAYLATSSGLKVSDVLRDSVDFYYRHVRAQTGQLKHLSRFIGQGDSGRSDISANVKKFIGEDLDAKFLPTAQKAGKRAKSAP